MGHTRLGTVPKTQKWTEIVRLVAGSGLPPGASESPTKIGMIAAQTLDAAQKGLHKAVSDTGVRYAFYLLTQIALASRTSDWERVLLEHGIRLSDDSTVFDFTAQVQDAIDRYVTRSSSGATDLSEIAQQSAGEAITNLAGSETLNMFVGEGSELKNAMYSLSTRKGFGELGQRFFGRFIARFLNFYLSRVTATAVGGQRLRNLADVAQFNDALHLHCLQSARIVRDFCGQWYSKTQYQEGIDLDNTSGFLAVAMKKLRSELAQQRAEL